MDDDLIKRWLHAASKSYSLVTLTIERMLRLCAHREIPRDDLREAALSCRRAIEDIGHHLSELERLSFDESISRPNKSMDSDGE